MRTNPEKSEEFRKSKAWESPTSRFDLFERSAIDGTTAIRSHSFSGNERNRLFLQNNGAFSDVSFTSGVDLPNDFRSFAYLDYDNDGWLDIALTSPLQPRFHLYHNNIGKLKKKNRRITLRLVGGNATAKPCTEWSNRDAIGAKIFVFRKDGSKQLIQRACGEGTASQNSAALWIGTGEDAVIPKVEIHWPSGRCSKLTNLKAGNELSVSERENSSPPSSIKN